MIFQCCCQFQALSYKDLRNRRATAASLRGWMLDRTGKLSSALAYYKLDKDGDIVRGFALEKEMAHLLGTERGTPGLERTLYKRQTDPMPESWEVLTRIKKPEEEQKDVKITIDRDLQAYLATQLEGKKGAIVVLNPQNGDLLAMYSNPSFNLDEAQTLENAGSAAFGGPGVDVGKPGLDLGDPVGIVGGFRLGHQTCALGIGRQDRVEKRGFRRGHLLRDAADPGALGQGDRATFQRQLTPDQAEQRGFPSAVATDEAHFVAGWNRGGRALEKGAAFDVVGDVLDLQHGRGSALSADEGQLRPSGYSAGPLISSVLPKGSLM